MVCIATAFGAHRLKRARMELLRIASPTPRLDIEKRTKDSAPIAALKNLLGCGGRDRNRRCGHSRSLESWHPNESVDASHRSAPTKPLREVLADDSYRDQRANVRS